MNVNLKDPKTNETCLHILSKTKSNNVDNEIAKILMKAGARPDCQDFEGNTPITICINMKNYQLFEAYLTCFNIHDASLPDVPILTKQEKLEWKKKLFQNTNVKDKEQNKMEIDDNNNNNNNNNEIEDVKMIDVEDNKNEIEKNVNVNVNAINTNENEEEEKKIE